MKPASLVAGVMLFVVLATANSGGYRYGVSDQAFYLPAVHLQLTPDLFPRDAPLIEAQGRLVVSDDILAAIVRTTGVSLPHLSIALYVIGLVLLIGAAIAFARGLGFSWWAVTLFGLLLTFRHRIAKTGANSLEGYMHPRELAFAIGVASLASLVRGQYGLAMVLVVASAVFHPTTALFFGLVVVTAYGRRHVVALLAIGAAVSIAAVWALSAGPLAGRLVTMDPDWLRVFTEKDYLFPAEWPVDAWLINLAYPVIVFTAWRRRDVRGLAGPHERSLVIGLIASVVFFLVSVPMTMAAIALAVQLQITRVFWILDFVAVAYIAWWLAQSKTAATIAIGVCLIGSIARGYYLLEVDPASARSTTAGRQGRQLVTIGLPDTPWMDAMRWLSAQPSDWHVLADPGHAWKYGISVRVGAHRDTLLESQKDSAIAIYDRGVAMRVADRAHYTTEYDQMSEAKLRLLDEKYDLDVAVVTAGKALNLPLLYRNAGFAIYDLR